MLANNDYKQLSAAAIAGDVAMFLGGNWQIHELKDALPPEEFAQVGHRADSAVPTRPGAHRHRRLDLGGLRDAIRRSARGGEVHPRCRGAAQRRAHQRRHRTASGAAAASIATTRVPRGAVRVLRRDAGAARARPAVPIYNAISRELQVAIGYAIEGTRTPEQAVDEAFRVVVEEDTRRRVAHVRYGVGRRSAGVGAGRWSRLLWRLRAGRARGRGIRMWLAPAIVLVAVFLLYPILELVRIAFTDLGAPRRTAIATRCTDSARCRRRRSSAG